LINNNSKNKMKTKTMYAKDWSQAVEAGSDCYTSMGVAQCDCGETSCLDCWDVDKNSIEDRIIVFESCYNDAPQIRRVG
jgi:hypothetical protein